MYFQKNETASSAAVRYNLVAYLFTFHHSQWKAYVLIDKRPKEIIRRKKSVAYSYYRTLTF